MPPQIYGGPPRRLPGEPRSDDRLARAISFSDSRTGLVEQQDAARRHIEEQTDFLEVIAAWKTDLIERIARAQLRFELCGLDADEQEQLAAEVESFRRVCRVLVWPGKAAA